MCYWKPSSHTKDNSIINFVAVAKVDKSFLSAKQITDIFRRKMQILVFLDQMLVFLDQVVFLRPDVGFLRPDVGFLRPAHIQYTVYQ